ncbi:methyltransferase domain-containing protein [Ponticaulis sp.]|uniref:tRNA1(Val) (adenine(37)-N6)-methyltransferase n=1 Tax=Ponticaulis sp. TaxID=2020902 RepID=UPI000B698C2B|nr:methyltransferase domain-containing protein [Ponticaulis sp.]MAI91470.1 SAM-dependent methyltransferase [Ponticaulis sp.]OUX97824.1 MAG: SAM-dependent methyltransferase [Hyphomonadaceae bacterium TMED5]|tara:strand:+ start:21861 stop:22598 length:738 start_codon:yes stop_codon:yes gene_type:complete
MSNVTEDWLLNEQVRIFQPEKGYRAGLDAILLAASLSEKPGQHVLDIGCGAGGALFPAAWRLSESRFTGLERDETMLPLAQRGVEENGFSDRVEIASQDVSDIPADWENRFDQVMSNPPYFEPGKIQTVHEGRTHAYMAEVPLKDWLKAMLFVTKPKGRITLVHRAGELGEILAYLISRAGQIEILPIRSAPGEPAKRVIVTGRKGLRRGETVLHEGLIMHQAKGDPAYTSRAADILAGAALDWH